MKPTEIFIKWFEEELKFSKARIPSAECILSNCEINNDKFISHVIV